VNISIFGLGYVGCVGLGCLAELGHNVIGVDIDENKVNLINDGKATIVEKDIDELIKKNRDKNKIRATSNVEEAVLNSDAAIICVGTPNDANWHLNMRYIANVAKNISKVLKEKSSFFTISIRSTVMPGTNEKVCDIVERISGKKRNEDFAVVSNPEFLREGTAVQDFFNPPYTILASNSKIGIKVMKKVYEKIDAKIYVTEIGVAELIKFVNNSFHGLKVGFANEVGRICKTLGIDSWEVMDLFTKDTTLNISSYYFKPGFAYGGSCLPKDLKAFNTIAHDNYVNVPILSAINQSNQAHIDFAYNTIIDKKVKKIGFLGISFKSGTDDLRFSPTLEIVERLIGKGYQVKIFDENINLSKLFGKNKEYLYNKLPHINNLLATTYDEFISDIELLVVSNSGKTISNILTRVSRKIKIFDISKKTKELKVLEEYEGICW